MLPCITTHLLGSNSPDPDNDGLHNLAEFILGTDTNNPDSDGDGLSDGFELQSGSDPLSGLAVSTGIIAYIQTQGPAVDVCAIDNIAVVAEGAEGVGVFNIFSDLSPTLIAQVDTPGTAQRVACSGSLIAMADGSGGLAIIDISQPANATNLHNILLGGAVEVVEASAGIAYAGTSSRRLYAVEMRTGIVLESVFFATGVRAVRVLGDYLYVLTGSELQVYTLFESGFSRLTTKSLR